VTGLSDRDREVVKEAVTSCLEQVGIDTKDPAETRADMAFLRAARRMWIVVLAAVATAVGTAFAVGSAITKP
jgi:hypothetical protein